MQRVARRRVYVSMLSSSYRFVSGDLPSSKWLLICIWQSGTELFKMMFVRADADNWWSLTAVICTVHSEQILFGLIQPLECSELMASHL